MRGFAAGLTTTLASALIFVSVLASAATAQGQNRQAIYDAAQQAFDKQAWAEAAQGFLQLLPTDPQKSLSRSEAVIATRYAGAALKLQKSDEAFLWIERALASAKLDADGQAEALVVKGDLERQRYDYRAAVAAYDRADALLAASPGESALAINARFGLAYAGMTVDPKHVLERMTTLLADPQFRKAESRSGVASAEDLAARAALNAGQKQEATTWADKAMADSGGLTPQVTYIQGTIRADAGLIAELRGDDYDAHRYFAYSGAGHLKDPSWLRSRAGDLPTCGEGPDAPHPDDSVVVTLAIGDDGVVSNATPTYASRPGVIGETFARAVSGWRWSPDKVKGVDPYWRYTVQFALRCVTRPEPETLQEPLFATTFAWLKARGLAKDEDLWPGGGGLRVSSADPRRKGPAGAVFLVAAMVTPYTDDRIPAFISRLDEAHAPSAVYALYYQRVIWAREARRNIDYKTINAAAAPTYSSWIARFEAQFPGDPAVTLLLLNQAIAYETAGDFRRAQAPLQAVLASKLAEDAPIRRVALLHRAIGLDRLGDAAGAKAMLAQSHLTGEQCSMFDTRPLPQKLSISDSVYPETANRWGFSGYVQESYDIAADGTVKNIRAVASYPPYIFDNATMLGVRTFRFIPPRLGGELVGCEGKVQNVDFAIDR